MSRLRTWIRSFFGFSRTETNAFLIMLPLMAVIASSTPLYRWWAKHHRFQEDADLRLLDSLVASWKWASPLPLSINGEGGNLGSPSLFIFNPNTATLEALTRLGMSKKLSLHIIHYVAKGGRFRIKNDLRKIYGMDSTLFARLHTYIDLPERTKTPEAARIPRSIIPAREPFDLNASDTAQLIRVKGIGPKLSLRIIDYRKRLGGFVSMDQLGEVFGLDSAAIHHLKEESFIHFDFLPRLININTAEEKELASLPYIRFPLAKSIVVYRFQHGGFSSVEDLQKLALMDEPTFQKIKPYITVKDQP